MLTNSMALQRLDHVARVRDIGSFRTFHMPCRVTDSGGEEITIRLADRDGDRNSANLLINRKYSERGYGDRHTIPTEGTCVTFTAWSGDRLFGTLSLTVDSPAGLASDRTFQEELDEFRQAPGVRICELTKFAFETSKRSLDILGSLFHFIFIYGTQNFDCTDLVIEVAPRHRRFYEAMLGFRQIGRVRVNDTVGSRSHLMWLKVSDIRHHIDAHTGARGSSSRSLYPFFFSQREEIGIRTRLLDEACGDTSRPSWTMPPARIDQYQYAQ
ncbi:MAG: acetyltransferase [Sphingomonadales bacterium]|nr:acetyltransferase [Sphingomonadales bacterium]